MLPDDVLSHRWELIMYERAPPETRTQILIHPSMRAGGGAWIGCGGAGPSAGRACRNE